MQRVSPRAPLLRLADYLPLAVLCGYLGGCGLVLVQLSWKVVVALPARGARADAARLAPGGARFAPAAALALLLYGAGARRIAPTRGALPLPRPRSHAP